MNSDKKIKRKYYLGLLVWMLVGAVLGFSVAIMNKLDLFEDISPLSIMNFTIKISPYALITTGLILITLTILVINKNKKKLLKRDYELYDEIDKSLSYGIVYINILSITNLLFFGLSAFGMYQFHKMNLILFIVELVVFMAYLFISIKLQAVIVNMIKEMNPEKKGNIYDKKFQKDWLNSCDEMEKNIMYETSYKSYILSLNVNIVIFIVLILLGMFFNIGFIAQIVVGLIILVQMISYSIYAIKIEHKD